MPRRGDFINHKKKLEKSRKFESPESENEYLAAGVDHEEAGEKWRAGDVTKSLRFCTRAVETYDAGLQRYPKSFDLAYNKARLQYEVTQQPRLLAQLPSSLTQLLDVALDSHRVALDIEQDYPDLLFNTAQLLTSRAEIGIESRNPPAANGDPAIHLLQEALELFQRCLSLQEYKFDQTLQYARQTTQPSAGSDEVSHEETSTTPSNTSEEEVWASIEEPVTRDVILDTLTAQLNTLALICNLGSSRVPDQLTWVEDYYQTNLRVKICSFNTTNRHYEVALAEARLICSLSDAAFRAGRVDLGTYERELTAAFAAVETTLIPDAQGLCDRADAELKFAASVHTSLAQAQENDLTQVGVICWKHITKALDSLSAASKVADAYNASSIHVRRGDSELLRLRLGNPPMSYDLAVRSRPTLLRNAEIYYRNALSLSQQSTEGEQEREEAEFKQAIAVALAGNQEKLAMQLKMREASVEALVQEMVDEGLLDQHSLTVISDITLT